MCKIFIEENGTYSIDCTNAVWATDRIHSDFQASKALLSDVDFIIESNNYIFMVEYKNANIPGAVNPDSFNPNDDKKFNTVVKKFYDSLHYLRLLDKSKPVQYIYVVEYPKGDKVTRAKLRNRLKTNLPFDLQNNIGTGIKLIDKVAVLSINEWNTDPIYKNYPIMPVTEENKVKE